MTAKLKLDTVNRKCNSYVLCDISRKGSLLKTVERSGAETTTVVQT